MRKIIYTDHAQERMNLRGISESLVRTALDTHTELKHEDDGDIQFIRNIRRGGRQTSIHVIAKQLREEGKDTWLIKTVWIRGEDDPIFFIGWIRTFLLRIFRRKQDQR